MEKMDVDEVKAPLLPKKDKKEAKDKEADISEEDKKMKNDLNMLVQRLSESDISLFLPSLETLRTLIRASTTSMTSVPKPLKFMRPHYVKMKEIYEKMPVGRAKQLCADVISALAMCSDEKSDCIDYRLKGLNEPIGDWGHEYVRHICMEMAAEWRKFSSEEAKAVTDPRIKQLTQLLREVIQHNMKHNAEVEAADLLFEIEQLPMLVEFVEEVDHSRVCLYLLSCAPLTPNPDNHTLIRCAKDLYLKFGKGFEALRCAIMLNDIELIRSIMLNCKDPLEQKQMAILLGRHQIFLELEDPKLAELNSNVNLYQYFHSLARELDIMEPKTPEAIYKSHLEQTSGTSLVSSFVKGLLNCGYGGELNENERVSHWVAASFGLVYRWDIDNFLKGCGQFLESNDDFIRAGIILATGIASCGVQRPVDPACAIVDSVQNDSSLVRVGSILGLGLAYANSKREAVVKDEPDGVVYALRKIFTDTQPSATTEVKGLAGLSLGLILVGTADHNAAGDLLTYLKGETLDFNDANNRFVALGTALIFLGTQERSEVFIESVRTLPELFDSITSTLIDVCAYAGTGNVLKIQSLLHICKDQDKEEKKEEKSKTAKLDCFPKQAVAVLGIGLIAMGDDVGTQMSLRMFGHLMRYGEPVIRRAVPLALALISPSNPQLNILETLSKFSHDSDVDTARNAIFALGLVGAGTNNARLVSMLHQLAIYHAKDQTSMMLVRIAQGLTHLGKGTMTLNPFHSDRQLMCPAAVAGLFATCFALLNVKHEVLNNRQHYLLYCLVVAIQPRLLITLIEDEKNPDQLKEVNVSVRVGRAVDVVAQAGKPKAITGFQTHSTPVLLAYGEHAELVSDQYVSLTPFLEGLVILKKNPDHVKAGTATKRRRHSPT